MHQNLHAYRNLGVACLISKCGFCGRAAPQSAYFEPGNDRRKVCTLGCTGCGRAKNITENEYEALYEASFEYDSWREGEISFETFKQGLPEAFREEALEKERDSADLEWKCSDCGESVPDSTPECWNCGYEKGGDRRQDEKAESDTAVPIEEIGLRRENLKAISLSNGIGPLLNFGIGLGIAVQFVIVGLLYLDLLPNLFGFLQGEEQDHYDSWTGMFWLPIGMIVSILIGIVVSYRRFPKRIMITPQGVGIKARGSGTEICYGFESVRQVRYGDESKYLTLWFTDGKAYLVRITPADVIQLRHYFQMTS